MKTRWSLVNSTVGILLVSLLCSAQYGDITSVTPERDNRIVQPRREYRMKPNIDLSDLTREQVCNLLNALLADEYALYTKNLNYHWNVVGHDFYSNHLFFEKLYEKTFKMIDEIAERVRSLGGRAGGSMSEFLKTSHLTESTTGIPSTQQMFKDLLDGHEAIIRNLRLGVDKTQELGDMATNNFLCELLERHEKIAWMLRSSLER